MSYIKVERLVECPSEKTPFGCNSIVHYLVGYYVGSSFRVHGDVFDLNTAMYLKHVGECEYKRKYYVIKESVTVEKLNWL